MRFSVSRGALGACGLLLLAGCAEPESPTKPHAASPVVSTRTKAGAPELDLDDPLAIDRSLNGDDAAMLRQTPDYSITPSALTSDSTLGVASGVGVGIEPLQPTKATLPGGDLPGGESQAFPSTGVPASLDLQNEAKLDLEVRP